MGPVLGLIFRENRSTRELMSLSRAGAPKSREIIPIYPTPARYVSTFCPVSILFNYCKARNELCTVLDSDYLFPKMSSSFE